MHTASQRLFISELVEGETVVGSLGGPRESGRVDGVLDDEGNLRCLILDRSDDVGEGTLPGECGGVRRIGVEVDTFSVASGLKWSFRHEFDSCGDGESDL